MEHRRVWITMEDGTRLAARLFLPDELPAPVILEALPYRMDDLTSSYASEYERLCEEGGFAVCRLDIRGTGSSEGIAIDEYHPQEHADICEVIAWLAAQDWCTGKVGMYGTSWSGFNSIQVAMERPPALHAIVPIYASDDRYTDDVHYMGGVLKAIDLVDWVIYMAACNVLPPVPAVYGDGWREEWLRRIDGTEPWLLRWLEEQADGPYWRHGSLRPRYDRIACPTMIVAGWADGYTNIALRAFEAMTCPRRVIIGPWAHMSTATSIPGPHIDLVPELIRWFSRWLRDEPNGIDARAADRRLRAPLDPTRARSARDARRVALRADVAGRAARPAGAAARGRRARSDRRARRRRHGSLDLVRGEAAVGAPRRPARGRRALAHLRLGSARRRARGARPPARSARRDVAASRGVSLGAALRRLPGRHVGARQPRRPQSHASRRSHRPEAARARRPDVDGDRARGDVVGLRARASRAARTGRLGLAEHMAAASRGDARGRSLDGRARAPRARRSVASRRRRSSRRRDRATLATTTGQRQPPVVRRVERDVVGRDASRDELRLALRRPLRREDRGDYDGVVGVSADEPGTRWAARERATDRVARGGGHDRSAPRLPLDRERVHVVVEVIAAEDGDRRDRPSRAPLRADDPAAPAVAGHSGRLAVFDARAASWMVFRKREQLLRREEVNGMIRC